MSTLVQALLLYLQKCSDRPRHTTVLFRHLCCFRVDMTVCQTGADQLLQDGLSYGHHHGCGGCVAEPHGEKYGAAHEAQYQPAQEGGHFILLCVCVWGGAHIMTTFTIIIVFKCTKVWCSHARLGPCNHHHPQSNPFMKVPLLYGGRQANDSHQQQSCVFAVLCCYLNTHRGTKITTSNDKSTSFQTNSTDAGKINKMRCCRQEEVPRPSFHPVHPPSYRISTYGLLFLICSTSHQQRSQVCSVT